MMTKTAVSEQEVAWDTPLANTLRFSCQDPQPIEELKAFKESKVREYRISQYPLSDLAMIVLGLVCTAFYMVVAALVGYYLASSPWGLLAGALPLVSVFVISLSGALRSFSGEAKTRIFSLISASWLPDLISNLFGPPTKCWHSRNLADVVSDKAYIQGIATKVSLYCPGSVFSLLELWKMDKYGNNSVRSRVLLVYYAHETYFLDLDQNT